MPYQPGIPTGNLNLNEDYKNIQDNFSQLDTSFGVDHVKFSIIPNNGYHKSLHIIPQAAPATVAGIGQFYCTTVNDGIANDQTFYFKTGGGIVQQMTMNVAPKRGTNGYTFMAGGLLIQWGKYVAPAGVWPITEQDLTFATSNINFPAHCYNVTTTLSGTATPFTSGDIFIGTLSTTSFKWRFSGATNANVTGFYWVAIGN